MFLKIIKMNTQTALNKMKIKSLLIFCIFFSVLNAQTNKNSFQNLIHNFEKEYTQLNIPAINLSYVSNLENIGSKKDLKAQKLFFEKYKDSINPYSNIELSNEEQLTLEVLMYEIDLNLERIDLETKWVSGNYSIKGTRIFDEDLGKQWYAYFLKKWIDKELTPDAAYQFGLKETEKVKARIENIKNKTENESFEKQLDESNFLLNNNKVISEKYNAINVKVRQNAKYYFPYLDEIPPINIQEGTNSEMAIAPAYYNENTFYYNFFDDSYNSEEMGWVFLHEAIPGHHYQHYLNTKFSTPVRDLFNYMGYLEGWGAYVEQYGNILGAYETPKDEYAQLQWDLIRSMRVALDVGLNFYGWSDEEAFTFWNQHLTNKEDIAKREIKRMKRWPAQVITYKYGKQILNELKKDINSADELKIFHQQILEDGVLPLSVLRKNVLKKQELQAKKEQQYQSKLSSIDFTINSLYQVISGSKGEERDWDFLRYIFHPEAKFIFSGKRKDGSFGARYVSMDDYINNSGKLMLENGFYEKELHRVTEQFGQIAHVFTSYECFHNQEDEKPFMRGINSTQLMYTGKRWMVMSIYFTQETEDNPIPQQYLGNK